MCCTSFLSCVDGSWTATTLNVTNSDMEVNSEAGCRRRDVQRVNYILSLAAFAAILFQQSAAIGQEDGALRRRPAVEDAASLGIGRAVPDIAINPVKGERTTLSKLLKDRRGLVLCMTSTECPLAIRYAPRLARIEDDYAKRGITFVFVNCVDAESARNMEDAIRDQGFDGPYIADRRHEVQHAMAARTTTEVVVLDTSRKVTYRGAIDDQFGVGRALDAARHTYLRDALEALLNHKEPPVQATWPPGCMLDPRPTATMPASDVTYYGRVAHVIAKNCVECHRRGGVAPFSLETLQSVKGRFSMIEAVVRDRLMPPGHLLASDGDAESPWVNDHMLDNADREALLSWLGSDRAVGNRADGPTIPPLSQTWAIGKPDVLLTTPPLELPEYGPLQYGRFVVPTGVEQDRWISAVEFRPIERDSVHHALVWILSPGDAMPKVTEVPVNLELLGAFSPAGRLIEYPDGVARRLPAGSLLVVDMYASPMGRTKGSRLRTAIRFAAKPPRREVKSLIVSEQSLRIAAGATATARVKHRLTSPADIRAIMPYMRGRGKSMTIETRSHWLDTARMLEIERYDFRWPVRYERRTMLSLPVGARIEVTGQFDNSSAQVTNPDPSVEVQIGPRAGDEALMVALEIESDAKGQ